MRAPETIDRAVAIARGDALEGQNWAQLSPKGRDTAELGLRRVLAAGYRILGPDEVAQLERIAKGDIPGVWQEKFEKAQKIASALGRKA